MTRRHPFRRAAVLVLLATGQLACSDRDETTPVPVVDQIAAAIAAVDVAYGTPQRYFEISADLDAVDLVVAVGATGRSGADGLEGPHRAERSEFRDGELTGPEPVGEATGRTFAGEAVDVDPDRVFDRLRAELDDPVIVDFAVQGGPDGAVVYDATVASDAGGVLLVLLGPDGEIRAVQAE